MSQSQFDTSDFFKWAVGFVGASFAGTVAWFTARRETARTRLVTAQEVIDKDKKLLYDERMSEIVQLKKERDELKDVLDQVREELRKTRILLDRQLIITERQEIQIDMLLSTIDSSGYDGVKKGEVLRFRSVHPTIVKELQIPE